MPGPGLALARALAKAGRRLAAQARPDGRVRVRDPGPELETNPSFKPLNQIGKKGFRLGEFHYPYGMCLDADGDLYVADGFNHRVTVHNGTDFSSISQAGKRGDDPGELACPIAVHKCGSGFYAEENHYFEPPSAPQSEYMVHS